MLLIFGRFCLVYFVAVLVAAVVVTIANGPSWFLALKTMVRLALAASVVVAVFVGVGIEFRDTESREVTFDGSVDYVWPTIPIRVYSPPADGYAEALAPAILVMNRSVGCELFVEESMQVAAQVRVRGFDGMPCGKAFRDLHGTEAKDKPEGTWDCRDGTMEVLLNNPGGIDTAFRSILHGLGHVLRLAHDEEMGGIMAPVIAPLSVVAPNEKDAAALRARYCRK